MTDSHQPKPGKRSRADGTVRLLVIDDHPANRLLLCGQLERLGWEADFADNGLLALQQFARRTYQLVLTDLCMPALDGYGLASRLRVQGASVPIIAMSASTDEETLRRCADAGINQLLTKPFLPAELDAAICKYLPDAVADPLAQEAPFPPAFYDAMRKTSSASLARIRAALASNQQDAALAELHSMKGAFMVAQMRDAAIACETLQQRLLAGEHSAALAALGALQRATVQALRTAA